MSNPNPTPINAPTGAKSQNSASPVDTGICWAILQITAHHYRMTPEQFLERETREWIEALGVFAKECAGAKKNEKFIVGSAREIGELVDSIHDFKGRGRRRR